MRIHGNMNNFVWKCTERILEITFYDIAYQENVENDHHHVSYITHHEETYLGTACSMMDVMLAIIWDTRTLVLNSSEVLGSL